MKKWLAGFLAVLLSVLAIPTWVSAVSVETVETPTFEKFYVEGGTVFTAYKSTLDRITMTNGKWVAADGKTAAMITGGMSFASYPDGWRFGEDGGVYWRQYYSKNSAFLAGVGVVLPTELIPEADFTVEIVASCFGVQADDGSRYATSSSTHKYGLGGGDSFCIGNVRAHAWSALN